MNYGELRSFFKDLLNRDDCTDDLADKFISMGIRRVERVLRLPFQRKTVTVTVTPGFTGLSIPGDYLGANLMTINGQSLSRIAQGSAQDLAGYVMRANRFEFHPAPKVDDVIDLEYFAEFTDAETDGSVTHVTLLLNDVVVYAALFFAADYFVDARKADYDNTFKTLAAEVQGMADMDILTNASMAPYGGGIV